MIGKFVFALAFSALPLAAMADGQITGDAAAGKKVFRKCMACHAVGDDAKNKAGPILNGVVGRQVASIADFAYSDALLALGAEGKIWTPEELAAFITKPRVYVKSTKMNFVGLRKEADRDNIIAYLATFPGEGG